MHVGENWIFQKSGRRIAYLTFPSCLGYTPGILPLPDSESDMKVSYRLSQIDRASTFVVDRVKNCFSSSFITVHNLVVVSHTVRAHVGGPKNLGDAEAPPLGTERGRPPIETRTPPRVIISNFVALRQTVWT